MPELNRALTKVNKAWAKCKANQGTIKQAPSKTKQDLG